MFRSDEGEETRDLSRVNVCVNIVLLVFFVTGDAANLARVRVTVNFFQASL